MSFFVNIQTVFSTEVDRNIDSLSALYDNKQKLIGLIDELTKANLPDSVIFNKRVLLKPNWVLHNKNETDEICMRTHDNFLLAALEVVLRKKPASILIGDAPIQSCDWDKMIKPSFIQEVEKLSSCHKIPITIKDFRRVTYDPTKNNPVLERNPLSDYIIFDVGTRSYLEPVSKKDNNHFRVTNYNPDRLAESHQKGVHKYCITKELFDADVIISLPKVKTHQKTGITNALKILVGVNGDKDFLPHHRIGGSEHGGDCYPGNSFLRYWSELSMDNANRHQGKRIFWFWQKLGVVLWRISFPGVEHHLSAAWHGNDTTWRMVLDLNMIAVYGKKDESLANEPQRILYSLSDGIIGGEGDGPLLPEPFPLGVICFSNHSLLTDISMATLMRFDFTRIPLLSVSYKETLNDNVELTLNGTSVALSTLNNYSISAKPAPGWVKYFKNLS